jgi:hypothetical protein
MSYEQGPNNPGLMKSKILPQWNLFKRKKNIELELSKQITSPSLAV